MVEYYSPVRTLHLAAVAISFSLFALRGVWMVLGSSRLQLRWVQIVPHVVDTVLLASAITLTVLIQQYPLSHDWLTAKTVALLAYIVLGSVALRPGQTKAVRVAAWIAALATFAYIAGVALTHSPLPIVAW